MSKSIFQVIRLIQQQQQQQQQLQNEQQLKKEIRRNNGWLNRRTSHKLYQHNKRHTQNYLSKRQPRSNRPKHAQQRREERRC